MKIPSLFFLTIVVILLISACGIQPSATNIPDTDKLDSLPPWDYAKAAKVITTGECSCCYREPIYDTPTETRLLLWRVKEDKRPNGIVRVEEAVWWAEFDSTSRGKYWVLAKAYRHPEENIPDSGTWYLAGICDSPYNPIMRFGSQPPTSYDVFAILDCCHQITTELMPYIQSEYSPGSITASGFTVLDGAFRESTWNEVIGNQ